jgi:hypothetical protein
MRAAPESVSIVTLAVMDRGKRGPVKMRFCVGIVSTV